MLKNLKPGLQCIWHGELQFHNHFGFAQDLETTVVIEEDRLYVAGDEFHAQKTHPRFFRLIDHICQ